MGVSGFNCGGAGDQISSVIGVVVSHTAAVGGTGEVSGVMGMGAG